MELEPTALQQLNLDRVFSLLTLNQTTKQLTQNLFLQYIKATNSQHQTHGIISAALAAWKCEVVASTSSEAAPIESNLSISKIFQVLRALSKEPVVLEDFVRELKQFTMRTPLPEEVRRELKGIVEKMAMILTLFLKYQRLFNLLRFQTNSNEDKEYVERLRKFGWLTILNVKTYLLKEPALVEVYFLLLNSFTFVALNSHVKISFEANQKNPSADQSQDQDTSIKNALFDLEPLLKENQTSLSESSHLIPQLLNKMIEEGALTNPQAEDLKGVLSPSVFAENVSSLEQNYVKSLASQDIDESFYLYIAPPGNATPVTKPEGNKTTTTTQPEGCNNLSRKPLSYEASEKVTMKSQLTDIKGSNQAMTSPFVGREEQPSGTPMTKALEMYNWLNEKVKFRKVEAGFPLGLDRCLSIFGEDCKNEILLRMQTILNRENVILEDDAKWQKVKKNLKDKGSQITNLYYSVLEAILVKEEKRASHTRITDILRQDPFHRSLIACAMETVFFINNFSGLSFADLLDLCGIQAFEFWRTIPNFVKFDTNLPQPLTKHFYHLEVKIIMNLAWKQGSVIHHIISRFSEKSPKKEDEKENHNDFNSKSNFLTCSSKENSNDLTLVEVRKFDGSAPRRRDSFNEEPRRRRDSIHEEPKEEDPNKIELTHSQELFFKRLLHHTAIQISQLCDLLKLDEKKSEHVWTLMKHLISSHALLFIGRHMSQMILCCVYGVCKVFRDPIKFHEIINKYQELPFFDEDDYTEVVYHVYLDGNRHADIIKFYNEVFLGSVKSFLFSLNSAPSQSTTPQIGRSIVPQLILQSPLKDFLSIPQKANTPSIPRVGLTPQTTALYAFAESPFGVLESINKIIGRRPTDGSKVVLSDLGNVFKKYALASESGLDKILGKREDKSDTGMVTSKRNLFGGAPR